ncbi:MAG: L,D-transpeptidase family protein [Streptosporangiales bacterium]|nr:L,D-transpeptidase family protein [Streptosporangiales bacterium]
MVRRLVGPGVLLVATALLATACGTANSAQSDKTPAAATKSASAKSTPSAKPSPTKTEEPFDLGDKKILQGAKGPRVEKLQRRLEELNYDPGKVDGQYGAATLVAVWAFQKVNGIEPTSTIGRKTRDALTDPKEPKVRVPNGAADRVEVMLKKQLLVAYEDDEIELISHISSGSGVEYCEEYTDEVTGESGTSCGVAVTPTGDYKASRRIPGWRKSKLGLLYNPIYFNGGIAFHGAPSVPLYPASHGCVRIPMHTANSFPDMVAHNERVYVRN